MKRSDITQELLKSLLHYDPETGVFTWIAGRRIGKRAGHKATRGYISIKIGDTPFMAHRLAWLYMTGAFPKNLTDHINRMEWDNRFENLREATSAENVQNQTLQAGNTSGKKGVNFNKSSGKWQARICTNNKRVYLGEFSDIEKAGAAYNAAEIKYHGEFAPA